MKVVVHGVHLSLSESLKRHALEQLAAPLQRLLPEEAAELDVMLVDTTHGEKGGLDKECRVTLHIPGAPALHLVEVSEDIFKSVSLASDRLENAAKRHLGRLRQVQDRGAAEPL